MPGGGGFHGFAVAVGDATDEQEGLPMSMSGATKDRVGSRSLPPFRADHVGSLLRPRELAQARASRKAGTLSADALRAVENRCIEAAVQKQEELGLRAVTDGEYRRSYWHYDFVSGLDGVELY